MLSYSLEHGTPISDHTLKENWLSLPEAINEPKSKSGVDAHECLPAYMLTCWLAWACTGLVQKTIAAMRLWAQRPYTVLGLSVHWLLHSSHLFWNGSRALRVEIDVRCPICGWALYWQCLNFHEPSSTAERNFWWGLSTASF